MIPGYEVVQQLSRNEWQVHYRGLRVHDGLPVLIKIPRRQPAAPADMDLLEHEFALLRNLAVSGVPRAYEVTRRDGRCGLVTEDLGGSPVSSIARTQPMSLRAALEMASKVAAILAELHRKEICHKNITPESILIDPASGEVSLADFRLASRMATDTSGPPLPHLLRGALAYLSPEQTGRMNRSMDYRTDFYSLGVTLYELLIGRLPFATEDTLALIHAHMAKTPPSPTDLDPGIPDTVSAIVLKLLAKNADERYQSALGLKSDLDTCIGDLARAVPITSFPLGRRDVSDRFIVPQALYGRDRELSELLDAFDRVCRRQATPGSMTLVVGYSGIGKTSLIQELYKPLARQRGYFTSGKFDQFVRSVPFGALIGAFRGLIRQLLAESEERLAAWRERLAQSLGASGGVLVEVIPEIELVIGKQPPAISLGPTEALNRFQLAFQHFVAALASEEHPLILFLDDLQWADSATLSLLPSLLTSSESRSLFLISAYRDNEVDAGHPLTRTFATLESAGGELRRITLGPLALPELSEFVRDLLRCAPGDAEPLALLVLHKTGGNPFFVVEFVKALHRQGLLRFDHTQGYWTYRLEEISGAALTDNVVELLTHKIQGLSPATQRLLTLASCVGSPFDGRTLAVVSEQPPATVALDLHEAVKEGLVRAHASGDDDASPASYTFLHDRIQQAAYGLIPAHRRQAAHLAVGRLLLHTLDGVEAEEKLFDVVHHLNLGKDLIGDRSERRTLAELNLRAGRKAKASTAHDAALAYLQAGCLLLVESAWERDYELAFALHLEAAESQNLCGHFDAAQAALGVLLRHARSNFDKAKVFSLRVIQYENLSRYLEALESGRDGLALFGVTLPDVASDKKEALESELTTIGTHLGGRSIASLVELPVMVDPEIRMVMSILTTIWSCAYIAGDQPLTRLISATMVRLSLVHGNAEDSAYGYATHAITVGPLREDYQAADEFASLALAVNERFQDTKRRAKVCQQFQAHGALWRRPLQVCVDYAREAMRSGFESGDFNYAIYGAYTATWSALVITQDLAGFVEEYRPNVALFEKLKVASVGQAQTALINWARALRGETEAPTSLSADGFDEEDYMRTYGANSFFAICHAVTKLQLCYLFGEYARALEFARQGDAIIHHLEGTIWPVTFEFWNGLTLAANYPALNESEQAIATARLDRTERSFRSLAESCAANFQCQWLLLAAERARVGGRGEEAITCYERAIAYANQAHMVQHQALANELCARFWLQRGLSNVALAFLGEALFRYAEWGAVAKVNELRRRRPDLDERNRSGVQQAVSSGEMVGLGTARFPDSQDDRALDLMSVLKASQAIGGEIELPGLLSRLMRIVIENAGAERGILILEREGDAVVVATATLDGITVEVDGASPAPAVDGPPSSIIGYVRRTLESLVLEDAAADERYGRDPYIVHRRPRSVMCIPILNQGRLVGVLYLENNKAHGAFTPERTRICLMLASQAAISLENARLYGEMKQENAQRRRAEEELRGSIAEVETLKNRLHAENLYLRDEIRREHNFEEMVGNSPALTEVLDQLEMIAPTDSTVLILGETGTGKELIARAIHNRSPRRERSLVKVNCGAISAGLVESELFGHVKGAFTGATDRRSGRFELADGGTLFLDEVGELPLDTQVKLLRVLQEGEYDPVGSSKSVKVDVRVIAATNRDLAKAVREGRFRSDLFYRLNVVPLTLPPLRDRPEDIPELVLFFLGRFAKKFGNGVTDVARETMDLLASYDWPGNIRELQNVVERGVVLSSGSVLELGRGQIGLSTERPSPSPARGKPSTATTPHAPTGPEAASMQAVERQHIQSILDRTAGVIEGPKGAAAILKLHPNTLRNRLKKLGLR